MRVLNVVTQMEGGGAQQVAWHLTRLLPDFGHATRLLFLYTKRPAYAGRPGVSSLFASRPGARGWMALPMRLARFLRAERPDAVITHTHYANVAVQPVAWALGIRVRVAVHHNVLHSYPPLVRPLDRLLGATGVYTRIVAVSREVARTAEAFPAAYRRRLAVIANGVEPPPDRVADAASPFPEGVPLIVAVGRLAAQKNHATLIRALARLPEAGLVLVGDGERRAELEQLAVSLGLGARVRFAGEVERPAVWAWLKRATVFAFPSFYEGAPLALIEAMAAGVPVVAGDIPAVREALDLADGRSAGLLIRPDDEAGLAAALGRVLGDRALAADLSARGRERAAAYALPAMIRRYHDVLV